MENKDRIMECAKDLFYAKGYDAVGVQEIVDRAGITKPTLYYYFGSKLGLLKALLEEGLSEFRRMIQKVLRTEEGIQGTLYQFAAAYCAFFEKDRKYYMMFMALFYSARENEAYQAVKPYVMEFYDAAVQAFERASGQLGNMRGRQEQFAIGFIGTINNFLLLKYERGQSDPAREKISDEQVRSLVGQFMYGIFS
ncbi:MAG TPA: TetR/AcrR family transcriptional regulator [Candidatus Choladousia intestinigallinarum]|nr:TetR/AcrR family transcriptional regulator [Candidatus Choladousia intestinigallinarum]